MIGQCIVVTSGKGGVGKTTSTANLGASLAMSGVRVCVVDSDIGLRNLDVVLGLENRIIYDLVNVIEGRCRLSQALIRDKRCDNLYLLPAAQTRDKTAINQAQMRDLIDELKKSFDFILVDCPAGIEQGFKNAIAGADKAIVVTTPEVSAIRDADRIIGMIEAAELPEPHLVINRYRPHMVDSGNMLSKDDILEILAVPLIGIVPEDQDILVSTNRGFPVAFEAESIVGEAFRRISRRVLGEDNVPYIDTTSQDGLWTMLKRWIRIGQHKEAM